ncbi:alpha/beta hydrolase [Microbacterium horticulturae]|uniref:Alpha/beta hydrolase n=1 Tax=Microbacterium horticulturae TaxID=3028316 RepID=A0ABY8BYT9_9MICO|nr:alpha/beta hydrolase [Microbacterium sp. KACC 23027]WEG09042.1 alpha/beta hydrolase [Microbacterium sp. KACC 23027]
MTEIPATVEPASGEAPTPRRRGVLSWLLVLLGVAGVIVVAWVCLTAWGGVVHGHPAYAVLLGVTAVASVLTVVAGVRGRRRGAWRATVTIIAIVLGAGWLAATAWMRPHTAVEPALAAMASDARVTVAESATEIVMTPADADTTAVFFQPGAFVDARAYAAVLRPLAEAGHPVIIAKQPLGIAFLALGAFDEARSRLPEATGWVVAGHSLGGTVAAIEADGADAASTAPAVGLMFFASYPASDLSGSLTTAVLSISGSNDGLSTPAKIDASHADLPADAQFVQIAGASHAQFGSYGAQAGDGTPTISDDEARAQISAAARDFVDALAG